MADGDVSEKLSSDCSPPPAVPIFSDRDSNSPLEKFLEAPPQAELEKILGFPLDEDRLKVFLEKEKAQRNPGQEGSLQEKLGNCFLDVHKALAMKNHSDAEAVEDSQLLPLPAEASQTLPSEASQALPTEASQALPPEALQALPPEAVQALLAQHLQAPTHEDSQISYEGPEETMQKGLHRLSDNGRPGDRDAPLGNVGELPTCTPEKTKPPIIVISPDSVETLS